MVKNLEEAFGRYKEEVRSYLHSRKQCQDLPPPHWTEGGLIVARSELARLFEESRRYRSVELEGMAKLLGLTPDEVNGIRAEIEEEIRGTAQ